MTEVPATRPGRVGARARLARTALFLTLAVAAVVLASAEPALARSYSVSAVDIVAEVQPDGSMLVTERRTFEFDGAFTFVFWELDEADSAGVEVLGMSGPEGPYTLTMQPDARDVRPPGTYQVTRAPGTLDVRAFFRAEDTSATFELRYRVLGAATRWADTGELYWKFVGERWEIPARNVRVTISLPGVSTRDEVRAWAHGPLTGLVEITEGGRVVLALDLLPANTFVEARTLFPADTLTALGPRAEAAEERIVAEESRLAEEANRRRAMARFSVAVAWVLGLGLAVAALLVSVVLFVRYGKEHTPSFTGQYYRDIPAELHPALVGAIWRMGKVGDAEVAATIMSLVNRGVLSIRPVTVQRSRFLGSRDIESLELTFDLSRYNETSDLDRELIRLWFHTISGGSDTLTIEDLKEWAKANSQTYVTRMDEWKKSVKAEADRRHYFEKAGAQGQVGVAAGGVVTFGALVALALWVGSPWLGAIGFLALAVCLALAAVMPRRSPEANDLFAKYRAVRNYLRDFSRLHEAPPGHVALWEEFLVLATVFGISKQVIEQLRSHVPAVADDPTFARHYGWAYASSAGGATGLGLAGLVDGVSSARSIASSQNSSSSGGGGGFSGGGGGGGGGAG